MVPLELRLVAGPPVAHEPVEAAVDPAVRSERLYRQLAPAVLGYLRAQQVPDPEDTLGEVFVQVVRDLPRVRGDDAAVRRWVFTLAHHRAVDAHRRRHRRPESLVADAPDRPEPAGPAPLDRALLDALGRLTDDQRAVVALRFVADLPLEVVAEVLGRRVGAVKALQHRALARLQQLVG